MDSARWDRIQSLFHAALEHPEAERQPYLEDVCDGDADLIADVLTLLREDSLSSSLLDRSLAQVAEKVLAEPISATLATRQFGPYRLKSLLGTGGMGVVYLAERDDIGATVALKILRDSWLSPVRRERFVREQRTLAQLNHPSIAHLYHADTLADGTPWFAMELVDGEPLTGYCRGHAPSLEDRLRLFRAVCEAVQYAHGQAIIHRDLKPSNILVRADGAIKLLDFGIAKHMDGLDGDPTRTGPQAMTPAYAAPEQVLGQRAGIYTDVYSLGVILYELVAGRLPLDLTGLTPAEAETRIVRQEPERPSSAAQREPNAVRAGSDLWADLDVLCLTAMHKDIERRYRSVEALIRDVDHLLKGEPLEARPDSVRYRVRKFIGRNRRAVIAATVASMMVIGLVLFFTVRLALARNRALAEAARTQRIQRFMLDLFAGGDRDTGPAEDVRVVALLERGEQETATLAGEPAIQAELRETLGSIYQKLGKLDKAEALLQAALSQRRSLFGADHEDVAHSLVALGLLRMDQALLEEAEKLVRDGLAMSQRHLPPRDIFVAKATTALGRVLEERGRYDQAIQVLNRATQLLSAPGAGSPELAANLYELANSHFYAGHYPESQALDERLLVMHGVLYGPRHPLIADDLVNLGAIQSQLGNYVDAEKFYRRALAITEAWYGKDHNKTASNLTMLGRALVYQNRFDEAEELLRQALGIQERVYGPLHPKVASALNDLGAAALQQGRLDEAEKSYRRIAAIYRTVYGEHHYLNGIAASNLATVYMGRKEFPQAEQLYRDALRVFQETLSAGDLNAAIARVKLGRSLLRQHRFSVAEEQTLAGYDLLSKQASPSVSFLQAARLDLSEEYDGLHQPDRAAHFRAERAQVIAASAKK